MEKDSGLLWFLGLAIIALTQALVLVLKIVATRNERKRLPAQVVHEESDNPGYGERIGQCETEIENMKENNEKDHRLMRKDIRRLFGLLNGMRK